MTKFNTLTDTIDGPPVGTLQTLIARNQEQTPRNLTRSIDKRPSGAPESARLAAKLAIAGSIQDLSPNDSRSIDEVLRGLSGMQINPSVSDVEAKNVSYYRENASFPDQERLAS